HRLSLPGTLKLTGLTGRGTGLPLANSRIRTRARTPTLRDAAGSGQDSGVPASQRKVEAETMWPPALRGGAAGRASELDHGALLGVSQFRVNPWAAASCHGRF